MATERGAAELRMDPTTLFREETFTDRRLGMIRVLTPVTRDGSPDLGRKVVYLGEAQLLTQVGALPLTFEIEAGSRWRVGHGAGPLQHFQWKNRP